MSSHIEEDTDSSLLDHSNPMLNDTDAMESNHDLPARTTIDDDDHDDLDEHDEHGHAQIQKDDPATMAASEELKHTTISDKIMAIPSANSAVGAEQRGFLRRDKEMANTNLRAGTPELLPGKVRDEEMLERISSPKKKRGRDQDEEEKEDEEGDGDEPTSSADGSVSNGGRTTRSGPEKKRPRDTSEEALRSGENKDGGVKADENTAPKSSTKVFGASNGRKVSDPSHKSPDDKPRTSASAFASSGFASLAASSTSGFGALGASKPSVFGRSTATSGFGALASKPSNAGSLGGFGGAATAKPLTGFGFGSTTASSGFGGLSSGSVFGSKLGNGFAGGSGPKLSSFAAPGKPSTVTSPKPAKAFGAPESDDDDGSSDDGSEGGAATDDEENGVPVEEKKKTKISKVHIDDGEAGEATLLQLRVKLFALENKEVGWKERGVGTLKINVPKECADYDENGCVIPHSFDPSPLNDEDDDSGPPHVPRLIMRQENTHRVILNTIVVSGMEFRDKPAASTAQILFTAFDGEKEMKPINMLLKMSEANAKLFREEIASVQRALPPPA